MFQELWKWFSMAENQFLLLGAFAGVFTGFLLGVLVFSRRRKDTDSITSRGDKAFFKGIQYLLSDDRDQAIEEFTKSVQVNSDTIETYVALGNLYRSKGDIDRAIRIRQTIILRPNIDEKIKLRALFDLGLDYRKGGFLNRALEAFLEVHEKDPSNKEVLEEVEKIYEDMKDWENAYTTRKKLTKLTHGKDEHVLSHHQTEIGKAFIEEGEIAKAKAAFKKAINIHEGCIDAYLHLGDLYFENQEYNKAMATWKKVVKIAPRFTFLAYRRLEGAYSEMRNLKPVEDFLQECAEFNSDAFTHHALAQYRYNEKDYNGALRELEVALELDPSFWEARKFMGEILLDHGEREDALNAYRKLLSNLHVPYLEFQCSNCGYRPPDLHWQCPQCGKWDTIDMIEVVTTESHSIPNPKLSSEDQPEGNSGGPE